MLQLLRRGWRGWGLLTAVPAAMHRRTPCWRHCLQVHMGWDRDNREDTWGGRQAKGRDPNTRVWSSRETAEPICSALNITDTTLIMWRLSHVCTSRSQAAIHSLPSFAISVCAMSHQQVFITLHMDATDDMAAMCFLLYYVCTHVQQNSLP